jgi:pyruvate dehydrogenase E1 component alpha subunit
VTPTWTVERLRAFEEEVRDIYLQGRIRAPVHLSRGNERQLLEIFQDVRTQDWVFSTYRSHYHALLKGVPREQVMAEILAGHSIHLTFPEHRFFTSAIVGGILPIALGVALGIKRRGRHQKVWCLVGDMAAETGAFQEAVKYAWGFDLPITFVVECNGLSTNTPTHQTWGMLHQHITLGETINRKQFDGWATGGIIRYCYDREWPHYGVGERVSFDEADKAPVGERSDVMA